VIFENKEKLAAMMLSAWSILLATPPAYAAARACAPEPVEADAQIGARWPDLPGAIRVALDGREDVDPCARITVRLDRSAIVVAVRLLDGRRASRAVSRKEDVVPTLVALLLVPEGNASASAPAPESMSPSASAGPPEAAPGPAPESPASGARETAGSAPRVDGRPRASTVVLSAAPSPAARDGVGLRFELSLATGGRVGDGFRGLAFGVVTGFDLGGWLVSMQGTAAQYQSAGEGPGTSSLLLAVRGGRRFRFAAPSSLSIDLVAGPALAVRGFGNRVAVSAQSGSSETPPPMDDGPWARLVASAVVNFRARSVVRPFAGVDGEMALGTGAAAATGAEPRLPAWTLGLVIGAAVGTP